MYQRKKQGPPEWNGGDDLVDSPDIPPSNRANNGKIETWRQRTVIVVAYSGVGRRAYTTAGTSLGVVSTAIAIIVHDRYK